MDSVKNTLAVFRRDLKAYFESPVAYVFMVGFLLLTGCLTFYFAHFYERREADLYWFFFWHPWVYLLLVPAATMGLWAEERRSGTIELLLTMPITLRQAALGKFLAAWVFIAIGIALTFPIVITTCILGHPDGGAIACGYLSSALVAAMYVAVGMLTSAMTRSQVISFVISMLICLLLLLAGFPPVTEIFARLGDKWNWLVNAVAALSFMPHYESMQRGVIDLRDLAYFASVVVFMFCAAQLVLENRKSA